MQRDHDARHGKDRMPMADRVAAGRLLAEWLADYRGRRDLLVLALPRGGVPVAAQVAAALSAPLDLMLVRKLGLPGYPELAMGAIAQGGVRVLNEEVVRGYGIDAATVDAVAASEQRELERRGRAYRGDRPLPTVAGRCVILVDDGLATGATMRAAIEATRQLGASEVVVAVPVAPRDTLDALAPRVDRLVCPHVPPGFRAVGQWYADFPQTGDEEVVALLRVAWQREAAP